MKKLFKWLFRLALVLVLLIVLLILFLDPIAKALVTRQIRLQTGLPVRIGKLFSGWRTANNEMVFELPMLHEGRPLGRILCPTVLSNTPGIRGIGCCQEGERAPKRQGMPREQRAGACKCSRRRGSLCAPDKLRLA